MTKKTTDNQQELNRAPRSADTRESLESRKPCSPSTLETPEPPEGYEYRWIRAEIANQPDKKNVMSRLREGFELVRAEKFKILNYQRFRMENILELLV